MDIAREIQSCGFAIIPEVLDSATIGQLKSALNRVEHSESVRTRVDIYAIRNLLDLVPEVRALAASPAIKRLVEPLLGEEAFPVRGIFFDKTIEAIGKLLGTKTFRLQFKKKAGSEIVLILCSSPPHSTPFQPTLTKNTNWLNH